MYFRSRQQVERCSYPMKVEPGRSTELTFVRLFAEPDEAFMPTHVVVKPESTIEYLEAEVPMTWRSDDTVIEFGVSSADQVWLKGKSDSREGWIRTEEDFAAVGVPQAG